MPQNSAEVYRVRAKSCTQLAHKAANAESKMALLDMARAWLALAGQAEKNSATTLVYETPEPRSRPQPAQQQQQQQPQQGNPQRDDPKPCDPKPCDSKPCDSKPCDPQNKD
jgi:hypothetical protein